MCDADYIYLRPTCFKNLHKAINKGGSLPQCLIIYSIKKRYLSKHSTKLQKFMNCQSSVFLISFYDPQAPDQTFRIQLLGGPRFWISWINPEVNSKALFSKSEFPFSLRLELRRNHLTALGGIILAHSKDKLTIHLWRRNDLPIGL